MFLQFNQPPFPNSSNEHNR